MCNERKNCRDGRGLNTKTMVWSKAQIDQWQNRAQKYFSGSAPIKSCKDTYQQRAQVQQQMLRVLNSFLDGSVTLREFNHIFQKKAHEEWNVLHLRGMSGGMFLNKLIKYVPEEDIFSHLLRMILRVPADQQDGQRHMRAFVRFLEGIIAAGQATRLQLQPARVPFFLSVWWHTQEVENWPIFYLQLRQSLLTEEDVAGLQDSTEPYFLLKTRFIALMQALGLTSWELEHLITWYTTNTIDARETELVSPMPHSSLPSPVTHQSQVTTDIISGKGNMVRKKEHIVIDHTYIQWLLAKIGLKVGCDVWVAIDDHENVCNGEKLGNLSLPSLPILVDPASQQIIQQADVLWLRKNEIIAAYEVQLTIMQAARSLLQLSDLAVLFPKRDVQFYVVTPQCCFKHMQSELSRPIFQRYDIHKRSKILIQENLVQHAEHILRWANNPSVIHDLTLYLGTTEQ